jgi:multidrug transporter EmrE-like cation transporter
MDYLFLSIAVVSVTAQFTLNKVYQKRFAKGIGSLLVFPILTGAVSALFFLCLTGFKLQFGTLTFGMALLYTVACTTYSILGLIIVRLGKLSVYMIFLMSGGMLLPFLYGIAFLGEIPTAARIAGIIVLTASLFVPFWRFGKKPADGKTPRKTDKLFFILCVRVFILNGCVSIVSKVHQIDTEALGTQQFMIWMNLWSFVLSAAAYGIYRLFSRLRKGGGIADKEKAGGKRLTGDGMEKLAADGRREAPISGADAPNDKTTDNKRPPVGRILFAAAFVSVIALIGCGSGLLLLNSAKNLDASVLYPMVTGGVIVLSAISGRLFFNEKLTPQILVSLGLTLMGTLLFLF